MRRDFVVLCGDFHQQAPLTTFAQGVLVDPLSRHQPGQRRHRGVLRMRPVGQCLNVVQWRHLRVQAIRCRSDRGQHVQPGSHVVLPQQFGQPPRHELHFTGGQRVVELARLVLGIVLP